MKNSKRYKAYMARRRRFLRHACEIKAICSECGKPLLYFYTYDAVCCISCDVWTEEKCSDPECEFCSKRPDSPMEALFIESEKITSYDRKYYRCVNYQRKVSGGAKHKRNQNELH
ncbi:MAG: toxin-antitoxin system protein [Ruminococcus flavefaciens]|nr:toxin-antitoxin system protein [Ruminococcus flavefaciens]